MIYNIPADVKDFPEHIPPHKQLSNGALQGVNDFQKIGYGGPCPPGGRHRYYFKLYALDTKLNLPAGATKKEVEKAMQGHIVGQAQQMGTYQR